MSSSGGNNDRRDDILTVSDGMYREEEGRAKYDYKNDNKDGFLADLLRYANKEEAEGDNNEILRIALPNDVVFACHCSIS